MNIYILKQMRGNFYIVLLEQLAQYFAGCFSCSSASYTLSDRPFFHCVDIPQNLGRLV
ncbi:hypothetical protein CHCC14598_0792 [Bacillus licheniformis]|nr:hypothetical protein CHCC15318_3198 [Bacillus licheniformis]TWN10760.1 hypothetical protein CHCC14564_3312 [Bacillus licheniformis LMG 17339]TWM56561.1 hypothetical protein CHCC14813_1949 [Bacillus licheniformis]TWM62906.1 hypothetical protein CHCC14810_3291 [Bacillus licheniformis]TWM91640.1 hypothetical protein CHCC14598_0792 [Bacillus licheniformis]